MAKKRKKRTLSIAQKKALEKGRKALAAKRKGKTVKKSVRKKVARKKTSGKKRSQKREVIIINGGNRKMARKRRTYRKRRKTRRRYTSRYMGAFSVKRTGKKVQSMLIDTSIGTAAAILITMLSAKVPIKQARIKAFVPLTAGIVMALLAKGKKADLIRKASTGAMIAGGLAVVKQFAPQFALAGEDEMYKENGITRQSLLGIPTDLMGIPSDIDDDTVDAYALEDTDLY